MEEFTELARKILQEVESLEKLEQEIEGEEDYVGKEESAGGEVNDGLAQPSESYEIIPEQPRPTRWTVVDKKLRKAYKKFTGNLQQRNITGPGDSEGDSEVVRWWDEAEQKELDAGICSFIKARNRQQREYFQALAAKPRRNFSLSSIAQQLEHFVANARQDRLELPPYSKRQRRQITAVAALYDLEARSCGRTGQTFFRTESTAPLGPERKKQLERFLLCGTGYAPTDEEMQQQQQLGQSARQSQQAASRLAAASQQSKKRKKRKKSGGQAEGHTAVCLNTAVNDAGLSVPLSADNMGSKLLALMGWSAGQGLGAQGQGVLEPVQVVKRRKRQGLGAD